MHKAPQLASLQDRSLGPFSLYIQYQPRRRVGHFDLDLFLKDKKGRHSCEPVVTGIYSKGNPSTKIFSWLDIHFLDHFSFDNGDAGALSKIEDLSERLFIESPLHEVTRRCMALNSLGIPPATTPLGQLLFAAGCSNIKAGAYDVQGSSRLAGEKAPDGAYEKRFTQRLIEQLEEYLGRNCNPEYQHIEDICRTNAGEILNQMIIK
jgi:hypothetical protein